MRKNEEEMKSLESNREEKEKGENEWGGKETVERKK